MAEHISRETYASSEPRKNDLVPVSALVTPWVHIKCKCGRPIDVSLDDAHLKDKIVNHGCCDDAVPLEQLRKTVDLFSKYVEARAELTRLDWDIDLEAPPWVCKV